MIIGIRFKDFWVNGLWVNWVNLDRARLAEKALDILRALLVVFKLEFTINRTQVMLDSVVILTEMLELPHVPTNLTYYFHFNNHLLVTDPLGQ